MHKTISPVANVIVYRKWNPDTWLVVGDIIGILGEIGVSTYIWATCNVKITFDTFAPEVAVTGSEVLQESLQIPSLMP